MTMITQVSAYQPLLQQLSRQIEINIQLRRDLAAAEVQFKQSLSDLEQQVNAAQAGLAKSKTKAAYTDTLLTELSQLQTAYARSSEAFRALTLQHETLTRDNAQLQLESKKNQDRLKRSKEEIQSLQQQLVAEQAATQKLQQQLVVLKESNAQALHACQQINERQTTELAILTKELLATREQAAKETQAREEHEQSITALHQQIQTIVERCASVEQRSEQQAREIADLTALLLAAEKRLQHSSITGTPERPANGRNNLKADLQLLKKSPLFDANWYLQTYPDVAKAGMNPAEHYLRHGGFENRNPSPHFDSGAYLRRYPDVRQAGANPLIHFLLDGERQGCEAEPVKESDGG